MLISSNPMISVLHILCGQSAKNVTQKAKGKNSTSIRALAGQDGKNEDCLKSDIIIDHIWLFGTKMIAALLGKQLGLSSELANNTKLVKTESKYN